MKKKFLLLSTVFIGLTIGLSSCGNDTSNEKKEVKEIEKEVPLKIGDKFEGGYIFFLDFEGKHGKICAPRSFGDDKEVSQKKAVKEAKDLTLNGFSDWRLPNSNELMMIASINRQDLFSFNDTRYWSGDTKKGNDGYDNYISIFYVYNISNSKEAESGETNIFEFENADDFAANYRVVRDF